MEFATAGFPRADSWKAGWQEKNIKLETIADVCANSGHLAVQRALSSRQKHIIVLFGVLPFHVARAIHEDLQPRSIAPIEKLMLSLPLRDKNTLLSHPGILLTDVLTIADQLDDSTVDDIIRLIKH